MNTSSSHLKLPPLSLRFMNENDEKFRSIGKDNIDLLEKYGLKNNSLILDLGSGYGRLAYALNDRFPSFSGNYIGMDILPKHVKWCKDNIEPKLANYRFEHLDIINDRYNPQGVIQADEVIIDYTPIDFDLVCLFSVFTHMYEKDIRHYLSQINNNLKTGGLCVATFFIYDYERIDKINTRNEGITMDYELNDHTKYYSSDDKLHAISYEREFVKELCNEFNFSLEKIVYGDWAGGRTGFYQDYVVLKKQ